MKLEFRPLRADEIKVRIRQLFEVNNVPTKADLVLYKDSRSDQNVLDDTVGPMNWQRRHTNNNANCIVSIYDEDKKIWVEKEDVGVESNVEKEKGLASDSFKRACINWGIGRELYTAPRIIVPCKDKSMKYRVSFIEYDENKKIVGLVIEELPCRSNNWTANIIFDWPKSNYSKPVTQAPSKPAEPKKAAEKEEASKTSSTKKTSTKKEASSKPANGIIAENVVPEDSAAEEIKKAANSETKKKDTILDLEKYAKLSKEEVNLTATYPLTLIENGEEQFFNFLKTNGMTSQRIAKQKEGLEAIKGKTMVQIVDNMTVKTFNGLKKIGILDCCDEQTNKAYECISKCLKDS